MLRLKYILPLLFVVVVACGQTGQIANGESGLSSRTKINETIVKANQHADTLVVHRTQITALNDSINDHRTELNNHTDSIAAHRTELNNHTDSINAHRTDIDANLDSIAVHRTLLDNHTDSIAAHRAVLDNHTDSIADHRTELNAHLDSIAAHRIVLDNHSDSITDHRTDIDANLDSVAVHRVELDNHTDSITALRTDIDNNTDSIFWTRSGTNLSPKTSGDDILLRTSSEVLTFSDGDTYIQEPVDDQIHWFVGGTSRWALSTTNLSLTVPITPTPNKTVDFGNSTHFINDAYMNKWFVANTSTYIDTSGTDLQFTDASGTYTLAQLAAGGIVDDSTWEEITIGLVNFDDGDVTIERTGSDLIFDDLNNTPKTLSQLIAGGLSLGAENQIPVTNAATDDFDYSSGLTYDGTVLYVTDTLSIGDSTPLDKFTLQATGDIGMLLKRNLGSNSIRTGYLRFESDAAGRYAEISGYREASSQEHGLKFYTYNTGSILAMTIKDNGRVGIGTDIPSEELDVEGDASATRMFIANASTYIDTTGANMRLTDATAGSITLDEFAKQLLTINAQTGTTYTLVLTDKSKYITLDNGAAITLTVPPNVDVAFEIGTQISIENKGAGQVTIAEGAAVTINAADSKDKLRVQFSVATLIKTGTNIWTLTGDIAL